MRGRDFVFNGQEIRITFSGGLSDMEEINLRGAENFELIDLLIGLADKRLYQAKNLGRDQIRFH